MRSSRVLRTSVLCVAALAMGVGFDGGGDVVAAQQNGNPSFPNSQNPKQAGSMPSDDIPMMAPNPLSGRMKEERIKAFNDQRHKRLEDDVSKLQALTNELKSDVDKANNDELSLDVVRKASEIEKLAHDVQSRMKN